mmetsp:Transcript_95242/g.218144  ORF Transcript_95242/g.218144 Transcript_95242/m.218144 type:complete len:294 (-) Transcript_95242:174-1055(-)
MAPRVEADEEVVAMLRAADAITIFSNETPVAQKPKPTTAPWLRRARAATAPDPNLPTRAPPSIPAPTPPVAGAAAAPPAKAPVYRPPGARGRPGPTLGQLWEQDGEVRQRMGAEILGLLKGAPVVDHEDKDEFHGPCLTMELVEPASKFTFLDFSHMYVRTASRRRSASSPATVRVVSDAPGPSAATPARIPSPTTSSMCGSAASVTTCGTPSALSAGASTLVDPLREAGVSNGALSGCPEQDDGWRPKIRTAVEWRTRQDDRDMTEAGWDSGPVTQRRKHKKLPGQVSWRNW